MKKYQVLMTGIFSLMLVFGLTLTSCENDSSDGGGGGFFGDTVKGRGGGNSNIAPAAPSIQT